MDYSQEKIFNLHQSDRVEDVLDLARRTDKFHAWKLLDIRLERLGMRWEYFVPR